MADLAEIQALAAELNRVWIALSIGVKAYQVELEEVRSRHWAGLLEQTEKAKQAEEAVRKAVAASPGLFRQPKTLILSDIRVGFRKGRDVTEIPDQDLSVALIRERLPDMAEELIQTKVTLVAAALKKLSPAQRAGIGVKVVPGALVTVAEPIETEIAKLVRAMLKEAE